MKLSIPIRENKRLSRKPGVYLFRDSLDCVLYIGRATSIKNRVLSYFSGKDSRGERIFKMVDKAKIVETIETETVLEAVILEANLIKKYQPKYNIDLKDDKSFSYFAVTKEEFPRIVIVRETALSQLRVWRKKKDALYDRTYGPYTSRQHMETVLKILRHIFPFHSGTQKTEKGCLYRQIGLCPGPYDRGITKAEYRKNIRSIEYVLRGHKKRLMVSLEKEMALEARKENFYRAKILRDQIFALKHIRDIALLTNGRQHTIYDERFGIQKNHRLSDGDYQVFRFEAYDVSNISGEYAVASMVVFENGESKKTEYRKFKIKSVEGINDVAMMRETLARRMRHTEWPIPDLIILDGGQGHLNMAIGLWEALGISVPLVAVAKGPTRKKVDIYTDPKFAPNPEFLADKILLERIREEAHRFAVAYHRKVREKAFLG